MCEQKSILKQKAITNLLTLFLSVQKLRQLMEFLTKGHSIIDFHYHSNQRCGSSSRKVCFACVYVAKVQIYICMVYGKEDEFHNGYNNRNVNG